MTTVSCDNCNNVFEMEDSYLPYQYCPMCGAKNEGGDIIKKQCPKCGDRIFPKEYKFCTKHGIELVDKNVGNGGIFTSMNSGT